MDIGTQLRNLLDQDGITQKQLAEALNISSTTLNGYVQNRRQPDAKMAIRLAFIFTPPQIIFMASPHSGILLSRLLMRKNVI